MKNAPAYVKVYSRLKNEINKGTYPVGGFLPKECELEKIYQVSRTTVRNAVKMLVQEGLVEVRQAKRRCCAISSARFRTGSRRIRG